MSRGARRKPASTRATREPTHARIAGESTTVVPAAAGPETYAPAGPWTRARLAALFFLLLVAGVYAASIPTSAIDTWTALGEGRYVLEHGVDDSDPFSFNSRPTAASLLPLGASPVRRAWAWLCPTGWINQNWLAEVVLIELYKAGGTDALFAWHILDLAGVAALIALAGWVRGANRELALVIAAAALLPGRMYYEIRAQDMTDLLAAALILLLALAARRSPRWIWLAVPLLAVRERPRGVRLGPDGARGLARGCNPDALPSGPGLTFLGGGHPAHRGGSRSRRRRHGDRQPLQDR